MAGTLTISTLSDGTNSTSATNCIQGSAKAWVNFNGTGTVSINASFNVSSITDNGTGDYTVNFTNAMPDANYSMGFMCKPNTDQGGMQYGRVVAIRYDTNPTTTSVRIVTATTGVGLEDFAKVTVQVFR